MRRILVSLFFVETGLFAGTTTLYAQDKGIQFVIEVDSCLDTQKMIAVGDESMHGYVPMIIRITNHSGKDYRFELKGFFQLTGLHDENGRFAGFLPQELRSPKFSSDSSAYLVRSGDARTIHLASAIFWNYDLQPDTRYEAHLHYGWTGRNEPHTARFFRGPLDSESFQFKTCR